MQIFGKRAKSSRKRMGKKGQSNIFGQLSALGVGIVGLVIVLVVSFLIMSEVGDNSDVTADANATAAVNELTDAASDIPGWVPLVVIAVIGALLLGLVRFFRG